MDVESTAYQGTQPKPDPAPPCVLVIFGAAGDLSHRLLIPALYNLARARLLPTNFVILGIDRLDQTADQFRSSLKETTGQFIKDKDAEAAGDSINAAVWDWLAKRIHYLSGDFGNPVTYSKLASLLNELEGSSGTGGNRIFYLAVAGRFFGIIVEQLGQAGLAREENGPWRRVVIEKPFGQDLVSARALNTKILGVLRESQIYRMDHFLGKETVQNIMVLRFANGLFEPLWHRDHIDHVQITVAETVGVEHRAAFYDGTGALRDMIPNHLFQLLALTAMEPPVSFGADAVRTEKAKVLDSVRPLSTEDVGRYVVRGQYGAGVVQNRKFAAYRDEPGVAKDSLSETYVALRLTIDNWRWAGVPFYLRTGKAMAARKTEVAIKFKQAPFAMFRDTPVDELAQNFLILRIQPDEGVWLQFNAKVPGPKVNIEGVRMEFKYADYFAAMSNTGYETLLYECMIGDSTLFQRADNVEVGWQVVQPILSTWKQRPAGRPPIYPAGSEGPVQGDELLARDGRSWRRIVE
jgi:glucose-6-phosphate 1-dehydrogenase